MWMYMYVCECNWVSVCKFDLWLQSQPIIKSLNLMIATTCLYVVIFVIVVLLFWKFIHAFMKVFFYFIFLPIPLEKILYWHWSIQKEKLKLILRPMISFRMFRHYIIRIVMKISAVFFDSEWDSLVGSPDHFQLLLGSRVLSTLKLVWVLRKLSELE